MAKVNMTLLFEDDAGIQRNYTSTFPVDHAGSQTGESRLFQERVAVVKVAKHERPLFTHNAVARNWLNFPKVSYDFSLESLDNVRNTQELWRELCNLVLSVEHDLRDALSYKELEPHEQPSFDDEAFKGSTFCTRRKCSISTVPFMD